jgi:hypothetical protein
MCSHKRQEEDLFYLEKLRFHQANLLDDEQYMYPVRSISRISIENLGESCLKHKFLESRKRPKNYNNISIVNESSKAFDYLFGLKVGSIPMEIELKDLKGMRFDADRQSFISNYEGNHYQEIPQPLHVELPNTEEVFSSTVHTSNNGSDISSQHLLFNFLNRFFSFWKAFMNSSAGTSCSMRNCKRLGPPCAKTCAAVRPASRR